MITKLTHVTILVRDQDEALRWYSEKLGFEKRADEIFGPGSRWLTVGPKGQKDLEIVLQKPDPAMHGKELANKLQKRIGQGIIWVLHTDNCRKDYETLQSRGVKFVSPPEEMPWGVSAVFEDLYGNPFNLVEPR
jgi:predicted enzyme related to lactoylglutathione lyase